MWIVFQRVTLSALLLLSVGAFRAAHPIHVSLAEITYQAERQELQLSVRIFSDDLDAALAQAGGYKFYFGTPQQRPGAEGALAAYLRSHLKITLPDGTSPALVWVGYEAGLDATWCYLKATNIADFTALSIENRVLFALFEDQANLMHVSRRGQTRSGRTTQYSPVAEFLWD